MDSAHHHQGRMSAGPATRETLYTTQEVAQWLRVSQETVQDWIRTGALTSVRYGKLIRIRQSDLDAFGEVRPGKHPPPAAAAQDAPR